MKILLFTSVSLLAIIGMASLSNLWEKWITPKTEVSATVLLEKVEKVVKLTTVEGNFSEIYNYNNHIVADIWPLRKKALVRIKANVAVGYDFDNLIIDINQESKSITIKKFPNPEILSIEHDIEYYNFENGLFNMITNEDITEMGIEAKQFISDKALESDLFDRAEEQKKELLDMLKFSMQASGWNLRFPESHLID